MKHSNQIQVLTTEKLEEFFQNQWNIIVDLNISIRNMSRLAIYRSLYHRDFFRVGLLQNQKVDIINSNSFVNNLIAFGSMHFLGAEAIMDKSLTELYGGLLNLIMTILGAIVVGVICLYVLRLEIKNIEVDYDIIQR